MTARINIYGDINIFSQWTVHDLIYMSTKFHKINISNDKVMLEYSDDIEKNEFICQLVLVESYINTYLNAHVIDLDMRMWRSGINSIDIFVRKNRVNFLQEIVDELKSCMPKCKKMFTKWFLYKLVMR